MEPKKARRLGKRVGWTAATAAAGVSAAYMSLARPDIELARSRSWLEDPYKGKTFEQVTQDVKGWEGTRDYLIRHMRFGATSDDPKRMHERGTAICFDAASLAKTLLEKDPQYETEVVTFSKGNDIPSHAITLVKDKKTGKYGSLGVYASDCIRPSYKSPESIYRRIKIVGAGMVGLPMKEERKPKLR